MSPPSSSLAPARRAAQLRTHGIFPALVAGLVLLLVAVISPNVAHAADEPAARRVLAQRISLQMLPPIRQPGRTTASSARALSVVTASLSPGEPGRRITLERASKLGWKSIATLSTNAAGRAEFFVPTARHDPASYRAVAASLHGVPQQKSEAVSSNAWGAAAFDDEFTGTSLGSAWEQRIQFYNPWGGRGCSKGSPAAVSVSRGAVHLSSMEDPESAVPCPAVDAAGNPLGDFPYRLNGNISTQHRMDFLYGIAAARMKFNRDPGAHAAFWLQPRGLLDTGPTPWGAEIDVVEWYGMKAGESQMASTVHAPLPSGDKIAYGGILRKPDRFLVNRSDAWWRNYHVFSVEWTPTEYVFRISGREVWRTDQGVSQDPEFLILSMLSSDFELPVGDPHLTQTATVDWVKMWQADPLP